jgi:hypothetical protein
MGIQAFVSILKVGVIFCVTGTLLSCGGNIFQAMSSKTSRDAIIEEIRNLTNELRFSEAVVLIEANPTILTSREDRFLFATAYAGSCGLTFASIFESLSSASGSPMEFSKNAFTTIPVNPDHCYEAQLWLESIGTVGERTTNENIALFLIGISKVGTYLRNRADTDMDGVLDVGYDSCDPAKLPAADVKQIISGFGLMIENLAAIGSNLSGGLSGSITGVGAVCTGLGLSCNVTDPNAVSNADADSFRDAIKSDSTTDLGIESCSISPACCP